ncbi:MAG: flippase [Haemophilus parainfluenzae]|nr:flippase [Haemophilus parainfluenzae]
MNIRYNFLMNFILTISNFLFPLITFPYVSRVLGPNGMGISSFAMSIISYFVILATLGSATYGIRACSQVGENKDELSKVTHEIIFINLITMIISYLFLYFCVHFFDGLHENKASIAIASFMILLNVCSVEWFYRGIEKYTYITIVSLLFKLIALVSSFIFIQKTSDYFSFILISVISLSGSGIINLLNIKKYINFKFYNDYNLKKHIKPMLTFFFMSLAISVYTYTDSVLLGLLTNLDEVGFYNVAVRIKGILISIVTSLGVVLLPKLSLYIKKGMMNEFSSLLILSLRFIVALSLPLVIFFIFFAKETILLLSGEQYFNSIPLLQISLVAVIIVGITNILGIQMLVPLGKEKKLFVSVLCGALINVVANFTLIPFLSSVGAAISMVLAEFTILLIQIYFLKKYMFLFMKVNYIKVILSSLISLGVVSIFRSFIFDNNFLLLLCSGSIFFIIYLITLLLLKERILIDVLKLELK